MVSQSISTMCTWIHRPLAPWLKISRILRVWHKLFFQPTLLPPAHSPRAPPLKPRLFSSSWLLIRSKRLLHFWTQTKCSLLFLYQDFLGPCFTFHQLSPCPGRIAPCALFLQANRQLLNTNHLRDLVLRSRAGHDERRRCSFLFSGTSSRRGDDFKEIIIWKHIVSKYGKCYEEKHLRQYKRESYVRWMGKGGVSEGELGFHGDLF